jgi:toxin ParE1/3/4
MTVYTVEMAKYADDDLRETFIYIAFDLKNPQAAEAFIERLQKAIYALDKTAEHHALYDKEPWRSRGLRSMNVRGYRVLYIADKKQALVTVLRVMYHGRDIDKQLEEIEFPLDS